LAGVSGRKGRGRAARRVSGERPGTDHRVVRQERLARDSPGTLRRRQRQLLLRGCPAKAWRNRGITAFRPEKMRLWYRFAEVIDGVVSTVTSESVSRLK